MRGFRERESRLRFEHLEPKQMLAGDVAVSVVEGNLIIQGDEAANQIAITAGPNAGQYVIRGLEGTRIHLANAPDVAPASDVVVSGVRHNVRIGMGGGNDLVMIHDAGFAGNVGIGTDGGNDTVRIGVRPPGTTPMLTSVAHGVIDRPSVTVRGDLTIFTGQLNDVVEIPNAFVGGQLEIRTGGGDDRVRLGGGTNAGTLTDADSALARPAVVVGRGTSVELGAGSDGFVARGVRSPQGVAVFGGEGRDEISISRVQAGEMLTVDAGPDEAADFIALSRVEARTALVETGGGNDVVRISDSTFGLLAVLLEKGDDKLTLRGVKSLSTFLSGGDGEDTLTLLGENLLGNYIIREFEIRGNVA